jgi:hypothetical protein
MECVSLNTLLEKHRDTLGDTITVLSIDCEGCEEEVLKDFAWDKFTVLTIIVERSEDCDATNKVMHLIEDKGFIAVNWETSDVIFVHPSVMDHLLGYHMA